MSVKVKESLFELIKSLTKSEKRYFKLYSSRHTIGDENNYVRLFDYIDKLIVYDEKLIFEEFENEAFINRFSITKKRLYDHILQALDAFYSATSIEAQLYTMLHSSDILYRKSLYDQAFRLLRSAEKIAIKHEKATILPEIRKKQKRLLENKAYNDIDERELDEIFLQDNLLEEIIHSYDLLWKVKSELFLRLSRYGNARTQETIELYDQIIDQVPALEDIPKNFEVTYLYHHIYSAHGFATGNLQSAYVHLKQNISHFEAHPQFTESFLNNFFSLLTNAIYVGEKTGHFEETNYFLSLLKAIPGNYDLSGREDLQIKLFASTASIELTLYSNRGEYNTLKKDLPEIIHDLKQYGEKISPVRKAFIQFKIAITEMASGNHSEALKWLNTVINESELDKNEDILSYTQIVYLLIHLEMKHDDLLAYSLKNVQRFLKSRNRLYSFESIFLQFIQKRIKCKNAIDAELLWEELYNQLYTLKEDAFESLALEYFDLLTWAEAKIKHRNFGELKKEKFQLEQKNRPNRPA